MLKGRWPCAKGGGGHVLKVRWPCAKGEVALC